MVMALVALTTVAGCGADAVDRPDEVRVLTETCRSMVERATGEELGAVDIRRLADALAREPGATGDAGLVSVMRRTCDEARRRTQTGRPVLRPLPGLGWPAPLPGRGGR